MLFKPWNPFNYADEGGTKITKNRFIPQMEYVGLGILTQPSSQDISNVVIKQRLKFIIPKDDCFLKTCHLCNKPLSLDKDVYMYRGDQGFCSIECRERQIYLDEMKEIEKTVKKFRQEQLKMRHRPLSSPSGQVKLLL